MSEIENNLRLRVVQAAARSDAAVRSPRALLGTSASRGASVCVPAPPAFQNWGAPQSRGDLFFVVSWNVPSSTRLPLISPLLPTSFIFAPFSLDRLQQLQLDIAELDTVSAELSDFCSTLDGEKQTAWCVMRHLGLLGAP